MTCLNVQSVTFVCVGHAFCSLLFVTEGICLSHRHYFLFLYITLLFCLLLPCAIMTCFYLTYFTVLVLFYRFPSVCVCIFLNFSTPLISAIDGFKGLEGMYLCVFSNRRGCCGTASWEMCQKSYDANFLLMFSFSLHGDHLKFCQLPLQMFPFSNTHLNTFSVLVLLVVFTSTVFFVHLVSEIVGATYLPAKCLRFALDLLNILLKQQVNCLPKWPNFPFSVSSQLSVFFSMSTARFDLAFIFYMQPKGECSESRFLLQIMIVGMPHFHFFSF